MFTRLYRAFSNLLERIAKSDLNGMANEYVRMYTASQTPHPEYSDIVSKMSNLSNTIEQKLLENTNLGCDSLLDFVEKEKCEKK